MARKKITIQEALQALKDQGVSVRVEEVGEAIIPETPSFIVAEEKPETKRRGRKSKKFKRLTLHSSHNIAGYPTYGPGIVEVPVEIASTLQYQDRIAREGDRRTFDKTHRSFLVGNRNIGGQSVNVGIPADEGIFQGGIDLDRVSIDKMLVIR